jgi:hypothetical protein
MLLYSRSGILNWALMALVVLALGWLATPSLAAVVAPGQDNDDSQVDPRTWPEIPIPPQPPAGIHEHEAVFPELNGRWLMKVGAGWQHNVSPQKVFFTDMVQLNLSVAKPFTEHLLPFVSCELGFGGLESALEQMSGEGRSSAFGLTLGLLGSVDFSQRHRGYASVAGGYFSRSMLWGETYRDPETGETSDGDSISMGDWGISLRTGFLIQLPHSTKTRFIDLGVGLQLSPAESLLFQDDETTLAGSEDDAWLIITLRFWDTL